ncbi:MAG: prenyltransferase [Candidatus Micrarchaeota archaeon]|nr:MAG: prenyltransferase [Candidatus Micrarchaeota archaeon]
MLQKLKAIIKLTRIEHSLIIIIAILTSSAISKSVSLSINYFLYFIPPILVSASSFIINDYFDVDVDRANKRNDRPLVNGSISKKEALFYYNISVLISIILALYLNIYAMLVIIAFILLAFLYSYKLKLIPLIGNIVIASTMAIPFIYGGLINGVRLDNTILVISAIAFFYGMAREIQGVIRDYDGDKLRNVKSIAMIIGKRWAAALAFLMNLIAVVLSIYVFYYDPPYRSDIIYIYTISLVDIALLYISYIYIIRSKRLSKNLGKRLRDYTLALMFIASLLYMIIALF